MNMKDIKSDSLFSVPSPDSPRRTRIRGRWDGEIGRRKVGVVGCQRQAVDDGQFVFLRKDLQLFDGFFKVAHGSILCAKGLLLVPTPDGGDIDDRFFGIDRLDLFEKALCAVKKALFACKGCPIVRAVSDSDEIGLKGKSFVENFLIKNFATDRLIEDFRAQRLRNSVGIGQG